MPTTKKSVTKLELKIHSANDELITYISQEDKKLGQLLILAEIKNYKNGKNILNQIIQGAKYHYFNSAANDPEKALEDALQKINFSISEIIKQETKGWLNQANIVIAALKEDDLHFSKIGFIRAFLITGKPITSSTNRSGERGNIADITETNAGAEINPIKVFSNIYSGSIPPESTVFLVTETILDYISQEKIKQIILTNSSNNTIIELKNILKKPSINDNISFGALLIDKREEQGQEIKNVKIEEKTDQIIGNKSIASEKKHLKKEKWLIDKMNTKIVIIFTIIALSSLILFKNLTHKQKVSKSKPAVATEKTEQKNTEYQILLNNIQAKLIDAQNLLIMSGAADKQKAERLLKETKNLITALPALNPSQKNQKQSLIKKVTLQLMQAQGIKITIPKLLAEIQEFSPQEIIRKENNIYIINYQDNNVYKLPLTVLPPALNKLGAATVSTGNRQGIGSLTKKINTNGDLTVFYHSLGGLAKLELTTNKILPLDWNRTALGGKDAPKSADIYQNKLYIIPQTNEILKYTASIAGFTQETKWLKETTPVDLNGAVDMAIDSTIWVLKENGEILKFFKGKREPFTTNINPPLGRPTRLWTDVDINYLYILDPATKRILILSKTGSIVNQLTAEGFVNLKDFAINEKDHKIYVLDGNRIYEVGF